MAVASALEVSARASSISAACSVPIAPGCVRTIDVGRLSCSRVGADALAASSSAATAKAMACPSKSFAACAAAASADSTATTISLASLTAAGSPAGAAASASSALVRTASALHASILAADS